MNVKKELEQVFVNSVEEMENWFEKNHAQQEGIWLVFYKKSSGKASFGIEEIVDTLLCYGWIDSLGGKVDDEKTKLKVSPRNPKSYWSAYNKKKVERLMAEGRIKPSGLKTIELAKKTGTWDALNDVENLVVPKDLAEALKKENLKGQWEKLAPSHKKEWLLALFQSKREETKMKMINKICDSLRP